MKIALLTFHDTTNFGSFLQTYGLYKSLNDLNLVCDILDYKCEAITKRELPKKKPENYSIKKIAAFILFEPNRRKKYRCFKRALARYMTFTKEYSRNNVNQINGLYDSIVVGSDILWDLGITGGDTAYYLDFVDDNTPKYAFSTSIGKPWSDNEKKQITPYLFRFKRIAVREEESKKWVEEVIGRKIESVCDPTMLISTDHWIQMANQSKYNKVTNRKPYVLLYFNDPSGQMMNEAKQYSKIHNTSIYVINYGLPKSEVKNIAPYEIEDFLWLVMHSDAVFTSSYHGFLFSLYFQKPVFYYNSNSKKHAIRFDAVINRLGIEACRRTGKKEYEDVNIDYNMVTPLIQSWRNDSMEVLKSFWGTNND